jgi:hypothetical protein
VHTLRLIQQFKNKVSMKSKFRVSIATQARQGVTSLSHILVLLVLVLVPTGVTSIELVSPEQKYVADPALAIPKNPFNYTLNAKGNWCSKQAAVLNGEVDIRLAIAGESVTVAIPDERGEAGAFANYLGDEFAFEPSNPGVYADLMDEVARRGKFSWRFTIHKYYFDLSDYSVTDVLVWLTANFDVAVSWWFELPTRVGRGITYPKGWYDASIIIVAKKKSEESGFKAFSWKEPFSNVVWLLLLVTLFLSAIVVLILEEGVTVPRLNIAEFEKFSSIVMLYIHKSFIVFTGHMDLQARTKPGQLVSFSLSFFAMLMLSAYTANLASFLVNQSINQIEVETVGDIVRKGYTMCVMDAAQKEAIEMEYPHARFKLKLFEADVYNGVLNMDCDYAISTVDAWKEFQNNPDTNPNCELTRVGRVFKVFDAGFAMAADSGVHCTSLLREVFHIHFLEMHDDGFIKELFEKDLKNKNDNRSCSEAEGLDSDSEQLNLKNLGGVFLLHGCLIGIAILSMIMGKYYNKHWREKIVASTVVKSFSKRMSRRDLVPQDEKDMPQCEYPRGSIVMSMTEKRNSTSSRTNGNDDIAFLKEQILVINEKLNDLNKPTTVSSEYPTNEFPLKLSGKPELTSYELSCVQNTMSGGKTPEE